MNYLSFGRPMERLFSPLQLIQSLAHPPWLFCDRSLKRSVAAWLETHEGERVGIVNKHCLFVCLFGCWIPFNHWTKRMTSTWLTTYYWDPSKPAYAKRVMHTNVTVEAYTHPHEYSCIQALACAPKNQHALIHLYCVHSEPQHIHLRKWTGANLVVFTCRLNWGRK